MNEKCFCHFDGYEVKDAKARKDIEVLDNKITTGITETFKETKNYVDSEVNKVNENINSGLSTISNGTPLVASSISEMSNTNRIYVNTTDGHWYYYNNATWVDGGVYQATEVASGSITKDKTSFYKPNEDNLFDKNAVTENKYVQWGSGVLLTPSDTGKYYATDFIEVEPGEPYMTNQMGQQMAWYDENKTYISGLNNNNGKVKAPWIAPDNAKYVRFTILGEVLDTIVFNKGGVLKTHTDYYKLLSDIPFLDKKYVSFKRTENLVDKNLTLKNYYPGGDGSIVVNTTSSDIYLTDFIPLEYGNKISSNTGMWIFAEYDENYSCIGQNFDSGTTYTPKKENCKYIRFTINVARIDEFMCVYGETAPSYYVPAYIPALDVKSIQLDMLSDEAVNELKNTGKLSGKRINFLGDSITWGYNGASSDGSRVNNPYPSIVDNILGTTSNNYGISGSTLGGDGTTPSEQGSTIGGGAMSIRYSEMSNNADYVIVFGGTNDFGSDRQVPLGQKGDTTNQTFYGSLEVLVNGLLNKYPSTKIAFITPLPRVNKDNNNFFNSKLEDYVNAIKEVCKKYSIPVLDFYNESGCAILNSSFKSNNVPDGLHPNQSYYYKLADKIANFIESL